jgi:hypothetical protein
MRLTDITAATGILAQVERQRQFMESLREPTILRSIRLQQERQELLQRSLLEPTTMQSIMAQQERIQRQLRSPVLEQLTRQQRLMDELIRGPQILRSLAAVHGSVPSGVIEQVEEYGDDLVDEITADAETAAEPVEALDEGLSRIAAEREAVVVALNRTSKILGGIYLGGVAIPPLVVVMVLVFVVLGEVADELLLEREKRAREQN